jgi:hypothetical protein
MNGFLRISALGFVFIAISLTSCSPSVNDMLGKWVECQFLSSANSLSGSQKGELIFYSDGRFEGKDVPLEYFIDTSPTRINVSGKWTIDMTPKGTFDPSRINLTFDPIKGFNLGFDSVLYLSIDRKVIFHGVGTEKLLFSKNNDGCN